MPVFQTSLVKIFQNLAWCVAGLKYFSRVFFFRQQRHQLTLEMASSACHDSLISACVGLPSYQECFAVDPNEILSKDRATRVSIILKWIRIISFVIRRGRTTLF